MTHHIPPRDQTVRVTEIFHSIQGESTYAGQPCVFIRLTGCPLRCTWCDTEYSFYGGTSLAIEEILAKVHAYGCPLVEVTGGEPLAQPDAFPLIARLCDAGYTVLIETGGSIDVRPVDRRAICPPVLTPAGELRRRTQHCCRRASPSSPPGTGRSRPTSRSGRARRSRR